MSAQVLCFDGLVIAGMARSDEHGRSGRSRAMPANLFTLGCSAALPVRPSMPAILIVPTLQRGNAAPDAPASGLRRAQTLTQATPANQAPSLRGLQHLHQGLHLARLVTGFGILRHHRHIQPGQRLFIHAQVLEQKSLHGATASGLQVSGER